MTKRELIVLLAERLRLPRTTVQAMLAELERLAGSELRKGHEFEIPNLARFAVRRRKARMGRNPATGQAIESPTTTIAATVRMKALAPAVASLKLKATPAPGRSAGDAVPAPPSGVTHATPSEHTGQIVRIHYGTDRKPGDGDGTFLEVRYLVKNGLAPGDRFGIRPVPTQAPTHWEFRPAR